MAKKYFDEGGIRFKVKKFKDNKKLKLGYAYIVKDKFIIPYRAECETLNDCYENGVGIYKCLENDQLVIVRPFGKKKQKKYSVDKAYEIDTDYIQKIIITEDISSGLDDNVLELDGGDIFNPPINENDNAFQKIIKKILDAKQIDLKAYGNRFESATAMGNYKRALLNHGMNTDRFIEWCNILDADYEVIIKDKPDCANPMGIKFTSKDL